MPSLNTPLIIVIKRHHVSDILCCSQNNVAYSLSARKILRAPQIRTTAAFTITSRTRHPTNHPSNMASSMLTSRTPDPTNDHPSKMAATYMAYTEVIKLQKHWTTNELSTISKTTTTTTTTMTDATTTLIIVQQQQTTATIFSPSPIWNRFLNIRRLLRIHQWTRSTSRHVWVC